jgi:hypothetical protein
MIRPSNLTGRSLLDRSRLLTVSTETFHRAASSRLVNSVSSVGLSVIIGGLPLIKLWRRQVSPIKKMPAGLTLSHIREHPQQRYKQ